MDQQLYQKLEMAMALLQPQQQQPQKNWFFIDFEDDGGMYEVEVDMVGLCIKPFRIETWLCVFIGRKEGSSRHGFES